MFHRMNRSDPTRTAQQIQDEIFRTMSPAERIQKMGEFSNFLLKLKHQKIEK